MSFDKYLNMACVFQASTFRVPGGHVLCNAKLGLLTNPLRK